MISEQSKGERLQRTTRRAIVVVRVLQLLLAANIILWTYNALRTDWAAVFAHGMLGPVTSLVLSGGLLVSFSIVIGLLKAMKNRETPFEAKNVGRVRRIAWAVGGIGLLQIAFDAFPKTVVDDAVENGMRTVSYYYAFNMTSILLIAMAIILWCISIVFEYGVELQQQSDETL